MVPFIARFAAAIVAGAALDRLLQHPRLAPMARSRTGRVALLALGWGLRRHRRTRLAGHAMSATARRIRRRGC